MASRSFRPSSSFSRPPFTRTTSNPNSPPIPPAKSPQPELHHALSPSQYFEGFSHARESVLATQQTVNTDASRFPRSRPIAIELPPKRIGSVVRTPTPPEPLSARGDLPGGYFPLHEEMNVARSYKPHPFQHDVAKASSRPATMMSDPDPPLRPQSKTRQAFAESFRSHSTAKDSLAMPMPLGKYHPSNYKNKGETDPSAALTPPPQQPAHARQESDIRKKLQQYQRDMVEQASIAGHIQMAARPENPRLAPLGSPGPVTPMELEEGAGYLVAGAGSAADPGSQQEMVGRMIRAEQERMQREGRGSPVATAGGR
ncbi:MAG: hypothetical protein M1818_002534 [Claussenomyces sp. TS43310]|nr:MAG: hypothetical protein M1818_002534 [Claussenomyces sp. TS43310]